MRTKQGAPVLKIEDMGDNGQFAGYGSVFGNKDSYGDIVMPGAFKRSLAAHRKAKSMPKLFWQHDSWVPIGKWTRIEEDDHGLLCEGQLNMEVQKAREAYALLKAGDIDGLSIGYRVVKADEDQTLGALQLKELSLIEVSVVSLPANALATVETVKAAETSRLIDRLADGERLTSREWESLLKSPEFGLSNAEAERAVRKNFHGQGEPAANGQGDPGTTDEATNFLAALAGLTGANQH